MGALFLSKLRCEDIGARKRKLLDDYRAAVDGIEYLAPKGFISDGTSTPRFLWRIAPPWTGLHKYAAVIHDWLYYSHITTRETADIVFLKLMQTSGVWWGKRRAMYYAVKWFGASSWENAHKRCLRDRQEGIDLCEK